MPNTTTSWSTSPWRWNARSTPSRLKPTRSSATCERPLRVLAQAVSRSIPSRSKASAAISAFDSRFAPLPHQRVAEPRADGGAPVAGRQLREAGDADRPVARGGRSGSRAARPARAWPPARRCSASGCVELVYGPPREEAGDRRVGGRARTARGASSARGVAQGQRRAGDDERVGLVRRCAASPARCYNGGDARRCSTTCTATSPRSRRCSPTRRRAGAERCILGGDYALFGGWPAETRRAAARARAARCGSAATASAGPPTPTRRPTTRSCRARSPRRATRSARSVVADLAALPPAPRDGDALVCHGSPVSDVRSFLPEPAGRRGRAARGRRPRRGCSSATPTSRSRGPRPAGSSS